jgi:hypothetical protein
MVSSQAVWRVVGHGQLLALAVGGITAFQFAVLAARRSAACVQREATHWLAAAGRPLRPALRFSDFLGGPARLRQR